MIPKQVTLTPPWNDRKVSQLEKMLVSIFGSGLQSRVGSYTGDGTDDRDFIIGMKVIFIYIQRKTAVAGNAVFAIREADGISFVPGSGFVSDAVKAFTPTGITMGTNVDINGSGLTYAYLAIG